MAVLPGLNLLLHQRVITHIKSAELVALHIGVQHPVRRFCCRTLASGQALAVTQQETKRIFFGKIVRSAAPQAYKTIWIIRLTQVGLQFGQHIVIEAKIGIGKCLFQNRASSKERHRRALCLIRRHQQHLAVALVKRSGNVSVDRFSKRDGAIVERNMNLRAVE